MALFAIYEVADIFGFAGDRLYEGVLMAIICTGDGGMEQSWFTGLASGVRVARSESRGGSYLLFSLVFGWLMDLETLLATFWILIGAGWRTVVGESGLTCMVAYAVLALLVNWGRQSPCRCRWCQSFADNHVAEISCSAVAYKGYVLEDFSTSFRSK